MEQIIASLMSGDLSTTSLLILFILGLLTKRFVPWWTYEEMQERLELYEKEAPNLIKEVQELLDSLDREEEEEYVTQPKARRPNGNIRRRSRKGDSNDLSQ